METQDTMELRDLPVDTRNYTIIDNITGKPIDQSTYSLTIDPEVIGKLNKLKLVNEEKIRQATLKGLYKNDTLVDTFTPEDNSVFSPVYDGDYIHPEDYNTQAPVEEKPVEEVVEEKIEEPTAPATEVIQQETLLSRVVARDPSTIVPEDIMETDETLENDGNTVENGENTENLEQPTENGENTATDNSVFTPQKTGLEEASEAIVKIDADKIGPAIKPPKDNGSAGKIKLDKMEIRETKAFAWLAYILFFLPLLINKNNRFVRIHANEGLELNIIEILAVILLVPYFLLPDATGTLHTVIIVMALAGLVLAGLCVLTVIPMIIFAMCGCQFQTPWLWKKRLIKVAETRE